MGVTTIAENAGRFLAVFGIVALVTMTGVSVYKATLVDDVYEGMDTFQGTTATGMPNPSTSDDPEVLRDWQNAQTIDSWATSMGRLGVGSLLSGIILLFAVVVYRGVKRVGVGLPHLLEAYHAAQTDGDPDGARLPQDDVDLPFGGS
jgi:hypothetical protein